MSEIVLDLSRLLSRISHPTPTGVDRCEMAYARGLLAAAPDRLKFSALHPAGIYGRLDCETVRRFLDNTEERWEKRGFSSSWGRQRSVLSTLVALRPKPVPLKRGSNRIYLQASPSNLTNKYRVRNILDRERARFVCLVHDLIPLQYPEYARVGGADEHARRVETIVSLTDGIISNSHATMNALQPWIDRSGRHPLSAVAHLGTHFSRVPKTAAGDKRPYFVCVSTIEPRKNHLLLLNIWRRLSESRGPDAVPKLILIGRRGWENEQIVDMLDRCEALKGCVEEYNGLPDAEATGLLANAVALLLPSFAEGYGMPVTEALTLGVPVLCSDLPALREAGGYPPLFLDPLDGPGWEQAILAYAQPCSSERNAQLARIADWTPPSWDKHMEIVLDLLHRLGE